VRLPKSLHRQLAERAEAEGVSQHQLAVTLLAMGLGRIAAREPAGGGTAPPSLGHAADAPSSWKSAGDPSRNPLPNPGHALERQSNNQEVAAKMAG
jgi:hypothetical protein